MDENIPKQSVNPSSLIDLRAELFRKQEEFKAQKLQKSTFIKGRVTEKKPNIWSKKNAGVLQRAERDLEAKAEEENSLEKSRKALAAKAKLYEKMTQGSEIPEEDGSKIFLVDFQKKAIDTIIEKRDEQRKARPVRTSEDKSNTMDDNSVTTEDNPANPDEEWVEFTDSLGRARTCMKRDLPELQRQDKALSNRESSELRAKPDLLSEDMRRELEREQWQREEEEALDRPTGPIHYADVQHNEVRNHGIGFYQFSKEEEERQAEMERLAELRKQTIDQRSKREQMKEKRKAMLESRLAKVKQRKLAREGGGTFSQAVLQPEPKSEERTDTKDDKSAEKDAVEAKVASLLQAVRKEENKSPAVREWDIGKTEYLTYQWENCKQKLEDERNPEFAPPAALYSMESVSQGRSISRGRGNVFGRGPGSRTQEPPEVKVYTREEYEEKCRKSAPGSQTKATPTSAEPVNVNLQDIPLPPQQNVVKSQTVFEQVHANLTNLTEQNPAPDGDQFQFVPGFDPTVPPCVTDTSQPPPGYVFTQLPSHPDTSQPPPGYVSTKVPSHPDTSQPPPGYVSTQVPSHPDTSQPPPGYVSTQIPSHSSGSSGSSETHPVPIDQTFSNQYNPTTIVQQAESSVSTESAVILPKLHIMDTRYIKNKEAPVLASLTSTGGEESSHVLTADDTRSTLVQTNPVISAAPVRYITEEK